MYKPDKELYEFSRFRLDVSERLLLREGRPVKVADKVFDTLSVLVRNSGRLVGKDQLMREVWADAIVEENNLDQKISTLRNLLGEGGKNKKKLIETVRGHGYRFNGEVKIVVGKSELTEKEVFSSVETGQANIRAGKDESVSDISTEDSRFLIERESEVNQICDLLGKRGVRLVTLTGVGGVGKTTLAKMVGDRLRTDFEEGKIFVELAAVTDHALVPAAIASSLGIKEASEKSVAEILKAYLSDRGEMLLILDNFEQVIDAGTYLAELIAASRNLKILVTSRVLLHVSAEREFNVPPLAVPLEILDWEHSNTEVKHVSKFESSEFIEKLASNESVQLFINRAQNAKPNFQLNEENAGSVAVICSKLEGLPLAIELAAARTKWMSPGTILSHLHSQLSLLKGGSRDIPARQQTMRGTIDWSYELLDDVEKKVFRHLSVFVGGFTIESAEGVCVGTTSDAVDLVTGLLEKSLLVSRELPGGDTRFRMLEVVREYAVGELEASGELFEIECRHAAYFLALGSEAELHLRAAQSREWLGRLEAEHDNIRAALRWANANDVNLGQRLSGAIWRFWWLHGHIREGCEQLEKFLSQPEAAEPTARTKMLLGAGFLNRLRGNFESSLLFAKEGLALAREIEDKITVAHCLHLLGSLLLDHEDFSHAERLFEEGLLTAKESGDKQISGLLFNGLGEISRLQKDYGRAENFYRQALALNREAGDRVRQTTNLINLGATALLQKDVDAAGSYYRDGLNISSKMDDMNGTLYCLEGLAGSYWAMQEPERAALLFGAADAARTANSLFIEPADRLPYDRSVAFVSYSMPDGAFSAAFAEGNKFPLHKAVALALE
ncbi:MAG: winged helix-turn-helix domain-containing protein [Pyrinomonadaceae bacterium]